MKNIHHWHKAGLFLALAWLPAALAGKYDPDKLRSFDFEIEKQTLEKIAQELQPLEIAKKYKLRTPILPPRLDKKQVGSLVVREVERQVENRFPRTRLDEIEGEAKKKFRLYQKGDLVRIKVRNRRFDRRWEFVTAHIWGIKQKGVLLGDVFYIYEDIDKQEYPHFFKDRRDHAIDGEINRLTLIYKTSRAAYERRVKRRAATTIWRHEGYIYRKAKRRWIPREEIFNWLYQREWKKVYPGFRQEIEQQVYRQNGFSWNEDLQRWEIRGRDDTGEELEPGARKPQLIDVWQEELKDIWKPKDEKDTGDGDDDIWKEEDDEAEGEKPKKKPKAGKKPAKAKKKTKSAADREAEALFDEDD